MDSKTTKTLVVAGAVGLAIYLFTQRKAIGGAVAKLLPTSIGAGEQVTAGSYRVLAARRPGLSYIPASGTVGGPLSFSSPSAGTFTRNVVVEGSSVMAEVAA